ncbi:MAG: tRNA (adenosine(37)-N6)-dimethylallyltransferase MiaA [Actinobacteria bacterium 69-20]|nr:MAG: tRNA (adenosine(37)-N6)-dimethylallyltransferase MiaA [Actinobacteria bacterium 69-20]
MSGGQRTPRGPDRLVVVTGPTGTGKSELALALAEQWGGEVINADSMQLYRGMNIGTAKLTVAERRGVPHRLLDVLDVTEKASVAAYQRDARAAIESVLASGRTPLLVGGSGLYIQSVVDDIAFPATDLTVRARLEAELTADGPEALWERLRRTDPAAANAIEPRNGRRVVRALEVVEVTGEPFTATFPAPGRPRYDAALICLDRDTAALDVRLAERVDAMMAAGFLAEVRALDAAGLRRGFTAWRALGYRQLLDVIDGTATVPEAVAATIAATRRFVRRQRSWFRRDPRLVWLDAADPQLAATAARLAAAHSVG